MHKSLKIRTLSYMLITIALSACTHELVADEELAKNLATAEGMIDAFYSFDPTKLQPYLSEAGKAEAGILGYQAWAERPALLKKKMSSPVRSPFKTTRLSRWKQASTLPIHFI